MSQTKYIGNNDAIMAYGQRTVNVEMQIHGKWERNHLAAVWYVPDISRNLFSIGQTLGKGFEFKASNTNVLLLEMILYA